MAEVDERTVSVMDGLHLRLKLGKIRDRGLVQIALVRGLFREISHDGGAHTWFEIERIAAGE
jgi:hypothetical protein